MSKDESEEIPEGHTFTDGQKEHFITFLEHGGEEILMTLFGRRQELLEKKMVNTDEMFELHRFQGRLKESVEMANLIKTTKKRLSNRLDNDE